MSDVERICEVNQERRRWAEEYQQSAELQDDATPRRAKRGTPLYRGDKRRRAMRAGSLVCAMVSGAGAAFLGMGIAMQHQDTIFLGAIVAAVFLLAGSAMEMEEEGDTL